MKHSRDGQYPMNKRAAVHPVIKPVGKNELKAKNWSNLHQIYPYLPTSLPVFDMYYWCAQTLPRQVWSIFQPGLWSSSHKQPVRFQLRHNYHLTDQDTQLFLLPGSLYRRIDDDIGKTKFSFTDCMIFREIS
jgi:hypothetical protein